MDLKGARRKNSLRKAANRSSTRTNNVRSSHKPNLISLKWSAQTDRLQRSLQRLYEDLDVGQILTDVTLVSSEGEVLEAHSVILSMCSPYFERVFSKIHRCRKSPAGNFVIILGNVKMVDLKNLVKFMYTGEISVAPSELDSLGKLGKFLEIEGLTKPDLQERVCTNDDNILDEFPTNDISSDDGLNSEPEMKYEVPTTELDDENDCQNDAEVTYRNRKGLEGEKGEQPQQSETGRLEVESEGEEDQHFSSEDSTDTGNSFNPCKKKRRRKTSRSGDDKAKRNSSEGIPTLQKFKRNSLSLAEKLNILSELETGKSQAQVANQFKVARQTINNMWRAKAKIRDDACKFNLTHKRIRPSEYPTLDSDVLHWFHSQLESNTPVNGPILKAKALEIAKTQNIDNFKASDGWLEGWKKRFGIGFGGYRKNAGDSNTSRARAKLKALEVQKAGGRSGFGFMGNNCQLQSTSSNSGSGPEKQQENTLLSTDSKLSHFPPDHVLGV